jgi:hypothetical protein
LITGKQPAQVLRKIRKALDPETVLGDTIELLKEDLYEKDEQGNPSPNLSNVSIDYEEGYNANYILSFTYLEFDDRAGKYRTFHFSTVIDLKTGNVVKAEDVFRPNLMEALERMVAQRFQKVLKAHVDKFKSDYPDIEEYYDDYKQDIAQGASLDNFTVNAEGVTFEFAYGMSPYYPEFDTETVTFSYEELKGYINPKGILGQFIPKL